MSEQTANPGSLLRFVKHLGPAGDDLTLIVLKGHLLIEELLNARLNEIARKPEALKGQWLSFRNLSRICEALLYGQNSAEAWFWSAITELNKIRNDLAHRLENPQLETKVDDMLRALERDVPAGLFVSIGSRAHRVREALAFLCGVVDGMSPKTSDNTTITPRPS